MPPVPASASSLPPRSKGVVEHGRVRLLSGLPVHRLKAGALGTVVHVYAGGEGLEVEFTRRGADPTVIALEAKDVEAITQ